jgi:hypothetical protein
MATKKRKPARKTAAKRKTPPRKANGQFKKRK